MAGKSGSSSLGTVNERRLRPVYDLLDNGNNKTAVHEADKVLKKQKDLSAAKVLKTIALHRLGRIDEAFSLSQEVALTGPTDENSLQGLTLYYRETQRTDLIPSIYEIALSKCPGNEDYMTHLFMSYVRMGKPKEMQRVALNLFKQHQKSPYLFWGVMSIVMQANDDEKLGKMMFLPLAEKMIEKHIMKVGLEAEAETRLYLMVLDALGKYEKALEVLEEEANKYFLINQSSIQVMVCVLNKKMEKWDKVNSYAKKQFAQNPDVWNYTLDYLTSLEELIKIGWKPQEADETSPEVDCSWDAAIKLFRDVKNIEIEVNSDRPRRGPHLAVFELITRIRNNAPDLNWEEQLGSMVDLIITHTKIFSSKPCCFGDIKRYIQATTDVEKALILQAISSVLLSFSTKDTKSLTNGDTDDRTKENEIQSHLTYLKIQRYLGHHETLSREEKLELVMDLLQRHKDGLKHSEYRPSTDLRAVDDYCLISANILYDLYLKEGDVEFAWRALYVLELAKQKSNVYYKFKFMLIRLYCDFGIFMPCANIYDSLDIKHVQQDTLGYLVCNSVSSLGHYQLASQAYEASRAYFLSNKRDSLEFLISCFKNGTFQKIPEFVSYRKRVQKSMQAANTLLEHAYMDLLTQADIESSLADLLDSSCLPNEVTKLDELTDNRDFSLTFDWTTDERSMNIEHVQTSFSLEKKWLRFREMEVRSVIRLLRKEDDGYSFLHELEESIQVLNDPDLEIKMPLHGPPLPRTASALRSNYPSVILQLLKLFDKILNESLNFDSSFENLSKSVISGIKESIASLSDVTTKATKHTNNCVDNCDVTSYVTSQEDVKTALSLPVPQSLKELTRTKLEKLVYVTEMFSLSALLAFNFQSHVANIKADVIKKRRRKKGKQEALPPIIHFYQGFEKELREIGLNLKSIISNMQSDAQIMTLDLSKASIEENIPNGETMQEGTCDADPNPKPAMDDLPTQLIKMAAGSIMNATKQLSRVVEGRLNNLKAIKI